MAEEVFVQKPWPLNNRRRTQRDYSLPRHYPRVAWRPKSDEISIRRERRKAEALGENSLRNPALLHRGSAVEEWRSATSQLARQRTQELVVCGASRIPWPRNPMNITQPKPLRSGLISALMREGVSNTICLKS